MDSITKRCVVLAAWACALSSQACNHTELMVLDDAAAKTDAPAETDAARDVASIDRATPRDAVTADTVPAIDVVTARDAVTAPDVVTPPPDVVTPAPDVVMPPGTDDAVIERVAGFPMSLGCSAHTTAMVTVRNTGTATWTTAAGYALGAVGDSDPLYTSDTRVRFPAGESVAPGATREFAIPLTAPGTAGTFTTDWRMVHDGVRWFGETTTQSVSVRCDTTTASDFRLSDVTIVSSPDVRSFPVTSHITSLSFRPGTFHIDHERRGTWEPVVIDPDGTTQEATVWVFFHIDGRWYGTGGERLRPNQNEKALDNPSSIGPDWLYDPGRWGVMTNYVPSPGELVGFMIVAGSTRSDDHVIVRERTAVVLIPFPRDGVTTSFPPFAYTE